MLYIWLNSCRRIEWNRDVLSPCYILDNPQPSMYLPWDVSTYLFFFDFNEQRSVLRITTETSRENLCFISPSPGICGSIFKNKIFPQMLWIVLSWTTVILLDDKSTLVQVVDWCRQATLHYLRQLWSRSLLPYVVTRPQWIQETTCCDNTSHKHPFTTHSFIINNYFAKIFEMAAPFVAILRLQSNAIYAIQFPGGLSSNVNTTCLELWSKKQITYS